MPTKIRVATRRSALALAQCRAFLKSWQEKVPELEFEELHVVTTGDKITDRPLADIGGKGLFLKEIEEAILDGRADIAVHSMKDVPPQLPPGLCLGGYPQREDPRDTLISADGHSLDTLPQGSVLGTSSLRRGVQIAARRPDLKIVPIRGNVGTRLEKCRRGDVDATVLAQAGLNRLGLQLEEASILTIEECLPAVGQGALAIEYRTANPEMADLLAPILDEETFVATSAERGVMEAVEGDCKTPVAAYARRLGPLLVLEAFLATPDGQICQKLKSEALYSADAQAAFSWGLALGQKLKAGLNEPLS
jgi:hydroxymethylbilane synthase